MDDFVRRSDILTALHSGNIDLGFVYKETYRKLREYSREVDKVIKSIPAADVAPVRRGRWVKAKGRWCTPGGDPVWECSECGKGRHVYGIEHGTYGSDIADGQWVSCPNCGAKMEVTE